MRGVLFSISKTLGSFLSGYILVVYFVLMLLMDIMCSFLEVPDGFVTFLGKLDFIHRGNSILLLLSLAVLFIIVSIILSEIKSYKKGVYIITLGLFIVLMFSTYDSIVSFLANKLTTISFITEKSTLLLGYIVIYLVLQIIKSLFKTNKLKVSTNISYEKVDDLITKYLHEEDNFNMALCESLIKKYGGNEHE